MIRAAARLVARDGVAGTSIGDVLAAAGASRGSVYHYFPGGRSELMVEAVVHGGEEIGVEFNAARRQPLPVAMPALVDVWRRRLVDADFRTGCPVAAGVAARATDPEAAEAAEQILLQWGRLLAARFREEGAADVVADDLADTVLTSIEGAVVLSRARRSAEPFDAVARRLQERVVAVLRQESDLGGNDAGDDSLG